MSLSSNPAPARTDAPVGAPGATAAPAVAARLVRRVGIAVAAGAGSWAAAVAALGTTPPAGTWQAAVVNVAAFAFQLGLAFLVTAQLRTGAIGTGRLARGLLHVEHGLLTVAMVSSLMWAFTPGLYDTGFFFVIDLFWPLSMLGMAALGVRIAIAGRWRGAARFWPLVAESWGPVVVPTAFLLPAVTQYVGAAHLLVGYVALGVLLFLRPELTGAR
ncbi:hypothetical protein SAMN06893096_108214 [Geodermatophilus pulveris]|uniref:Uncharacterized protein n=1 Tax=Geodermatophilus pulveris TaxID=1564159 RepID=A0A239HP62_9ACTN|nr:hypothetical protein [Geodermatophilus pulveris]SNS83117.1 hypothetical protein SAMN06893096_108214 [Geodermatophilus pulveris]